MKKEILLLHCLVIFSFVSEAQLLQLNSGQMVMNAKVHANDHIVPTGPGQDPIVIFDDDECVVNRNLIAGFAGNDYGFWCHEEALESSAFPYSVTRSGVNGFVFVNGDNSSTITITWDFGAQAYTCSKEGYFGFASNLALANLAFDIVSAPPNTPVNIYFQYSAFSGIGTDHEGADEDDARALDSLFLVGTELFSDANKNMSFESPPGLSGWNQILGKSGVINALVGMPITAAIEADLYAEIEHPATTCGKDSMDRTDAHFRGELILSIAPIEYPVAHVLTDDDLGLFSVDIGSDTELSDQNTVNNNVFDPGDAYKIKGPFMTPPGSDGIVDDSTLLGDEIAPLHPGLGAPVLSGISPNAIIPIYHDLDGIDLLNQQISIGSNRMAQTSGPCLKTLKHLFVSYDDDGPEHYSHGIPSIPTLSKSPLMDTTYGSSSAKNEIVQLDINLIPPYSAAFEFNIWSETDVHPNLAPNPDFYNLLDDDVDALDISEGLATCPIIYFSVDHEATGNTPNIPSLDPGIIYEYDQAGNLTAAIHPVLDLGLPLGVDIDAFEFVIIPDSNNVNAGRQALVFSVDDDDPLTTEDESGRLQSNVLYASYYDGTPAFALGNGQALRGDIDAISAWHYPLTGTQVELPTSLNETKFEPLIERISLSPNPVDNQTIISINYPELKNASLSILTIEGKLIAKMNLSHYQKDQTKIPLGDIVNLTKLERGIYAIQIQNKNQIFGNAKFVY